MIECIQQKCGKSLVIIYDCNLCNFLLYNFSEPAKASKIKRKKKLSYPKRVPSIVKHTRKLH